MKAKASGSEAWSHVGEAEVDLSDFVFKGPQEQQLLLSVALSHIEEAAQEGQEPFAELRAEISTTVLQVSHFS